MNARALLAWNLRRIHVERGLSQERLAFDAEVHRSYLGGLERQVENPTIDLLDRLARTLEVSIRDFFLHPAKGATRPNTLPRGRKSAGAIKRKSKRA